MTDCLWIGLGATAAVLVAVLAGSGLMTEIAQAFGSTSAVHGWLCLGFAMGVGYLIFRGWMSLTHEKASSRICALSGSPGGQRPSDPRKPAEIVDLNAMTKPSKRMTKAAAIHGAKETVTLHIDQDVLDFFQKDGRGWQDRINAALRKAAGQSND